MQVNKSDLLESGHRTVISQVTQGLDRQRAGEG
jgi:hypothetical protein